MSGSTAYLDTSAFVKLVVPEPESQALRNHLLGWRHRASAMLLRTEAIRALRRHGRHLVGPARRLLLDLYLVRLDEPLLDRAGELDSPEMRSLDAIHLAAALALGSELGVLITYDDRLATAAEAAGLIVASPR